MNFHPRRDMFHMASIIGVVAALALGSGISFGQDNAQRPRVGLSVWDTSQTNAQQLAPETLEEKNGWKPIATADTAHAFQGDAVISNGRLLAVAGSREPGSSYSRSARASRSSEGVSCWPPELPMIGSRSRKTAGPPSGLKSPRSRERPASASKKAISSLKSRAAGTLKTQRYDSSVPAVSP